MRNVYLDYSATAPVKKKSWKKWFRIFTEKFEIHPTYMIKGLAFKASIFSHWEQVAALIKECNPERSFYWAAQKQITGHFFGGACINLKEKSYYNSESWASCDSSFYHSYWSLEKHGFDVTYVGALTKTAWVNLQAGAGRCDYRWTIFAVSVMMDLITWNRNGSSQLREIAKDCKRNS